MEEKIKVTIEIGENLAGVFSDFDYDSEKREALEALFNNIPAIVSHMMMKLEMEKTKGGEK